MTEASQLRAAVREMLSAGRSGEDAIAFLRGKGCTKGQSVLLIADAAGLDMATATRLVHDSSAWRDQRDADSELNSSLWQTLEQHGELQPDGSVDITEWLNSGRGRHER